MKQILQNLKNGEVVLAEVPSPMAREGHVLIQTHASLISAGTERMLTEFGSASLVGKARQQPDKVKQVLNKIKTDGLLPTLEAVFSRLDEPMPLGYCNAGRVVEVSSSVSDLKIGDRVASNGPHAELVTVPRNLCCRIPKEVSDEEAAFTVIGSIALQGVRLAAPTIGERVGVIGLGLLGLITVQLLTANGCRVLGTDFLKDRLDLAAGFGAEVVDLSSGGDLVKAAEAFACGQGLDAVLITADTKSNEPVQQAAKASRKRGRIVLVGVTGLQLNRSDFYEKELTFQVSCSYGPGRYDPKYEQKGQDYPLGFVRWTEQRNFEAVLEFMAGGQLDVKPLITERVKLENYGKVYSDIGRSRSIASILVYSDSAKEERTVPVKNKAVSSGKRMGIIGAGNFTKMTVLPALKKNGALLEYISSANGLSGTHLAKKYGIAKSTTDYRQILLDPEVSLVLITTRHNLHAQMVVESLKAGKDVFVEKPLALSREEFNDIKEAYQEGKGSLTVGFNRRFSPHIQAIKKALGDRPGPMNLSATMNAGYIPPEVWVHDMEVGGGRIIGEACHLLDLVVYLAGSPIEAVCMNALGPNPAVNTDNASILLRFANGSNSVMNYFANGHKAYSKERVEGYSRGRVVVMDNFRRTEAFGFSGFKGLRTKIDKGHEAQFRLLTERLRSGGEALIPFAEIENVTLASFAAIESLRKGEWVKVG